MANPDKIIGLLTAGSIGGSGATPGELKKCWIPATDATAVGIGDPVKTAGSADADGVPTVTLAAAGDIPRGVIIAVEFDADNLKATHRPASIGRFVYVNQDPNVILHVQEDSVGGALAATNVGQNADWINPGVNTTTGGSQVELDSSTAATTNTLVLRIMELVQEPNNAIGVNAVWACKFNLHEFGSQTTGV